MTRHDKMWVLAIWIGWAVLMSFIFVGCATTIQPNRPPVASEQAKWKDSPWTGFIGSDRNVNLCGDADHMLELAEMQDSKLETIINNPKISNEARQVIKAQQRGVWQLEQDIQYWINTNCAEA